MANNIYPTFFFHGFLGHFSDFHFFLDLEKDETIKKSFYFENLYNYSFNTIDEFLNLFFKKLEKNNFSKINLVGYSMGGRLASLFALKFPNMVNKLILESSSFGIENNNEREKRFLSDLSLVDSTDFEDNFEIFLQNWYSQAIFGNIKEHHNFKNLVSSKIEELNIQNLKNIQKNFSVGKQDFIFNELKLLTIPTLYIYGEKDIKYKKIAQSLPKNIKLYEMLRCGHNTHFEKASLFFKEVSDFLNNFLS